MTITPDAHGGNMDTPELRAGIRLENQYLVTDRGLELLTDFPLEL